MVVVLVVVVVVVVAVVEMMMVAMVVVVLVLLLMVVVVVVVVVDSGEERGPRTRVPSGVLVALRESFRGLPGGPTSVTPVVTTGKGSHGARRVQPGVL